MVSCQGSCYRLPTEDLYDAEHKRCELKINQEHRTILKCTQYYTILEPTLGTTRCKDLFTIIYNTLHNASKKLHALIYYSWTTSSHVNS